MKMEKISSEKFNKLNFKELASIKGGNPSSTRITCETPTNGRPGGDTEIEITDDQSNMLEWYTIPKPMK
jgi:bacteriocin-like protein